MSEWGSQAGALAASEVSMADPITSRRQPGAVDQSVCVDGSGCADCAGCAPLRNCEDTRSVRGLRHDAPGCVDQVDALHATLLGFDERVGDGFFDCAN